ncbi:MAG: 7-carboxy-7-deazaguanine synthase QueE [Bacteroidales bacterium]|nr:7-carboxy-7-deazaguanine synthase QueE [Bacteroidales bacterium]HPD95841.1 7-carboxy-7-deazaguanine synthase QueE [Tenuifilaceae bacterium]HRX31429.1 7-carboxy-7-deazaguanine synthase QueE [Tenuifilaceae bacterium]
MNFNEVVKQFDSGKKLPLVEEFYTLQGEGFQTGRAAYFIRIGGCDVGCSWCDSKMSWNPDTFPPVNVDEIVERAASYPAKAVVVTGGEPSLYPLDYLCNQLKSRGIQTFVETSGAYPLTGQWDWICLSPKKQQPPTEGIFMMADELKVIIQSEEDFLWAEQNAQKVKTNCILFLQPEWSVYESIVPKIVDYIMENPKWRVSLQSHKYMHIP